MTQSLLDMCVLFQMINKDGAVVWRSGAGVNDYFMSSSVRLQTHLHPLPLPLPFVNHYKHPNQLEQMIKLVSHSEHGKLCNIFFSKLGGS